MPIQIRPMYYNPFVIIWTFAVCTVCLFSSHSFTLSCAHTIMHWLYIQVSLHVHPQDTFRVTPSKSTPSFRPGSTVFRASERYVFLFQRLILITKKKDDGFHYRKHIEVRGREGSANGRERGRKWREGGEKRVLDKVNTDWENYEREENRETATTGGAHTWIITPWFVVLLSLLFILPLFLLLLLLLLLRWRISSWRSTSRIPPCFRSGT